MSTNGSGMTPRTAKIAQASGMVSEQVDCTVDEAMDLMNARAFSSNTTLEVVALSVLEGDIRFD